MKKFQKVLLSIAILTILIACNDDDQGRQPEPKPNVNYPNYSQLEVGNYWIYERFSLDTNGVETPLNQFDSSYVEKDTLINGKAYYKLHLPSYGPKIVPEKFYLKDSLHYLVDSRGAILFSSQEFSTALKPIEYNYYAGDTTRMDTLYSRERRMTNKDSLVNVPAGLFSTLSSTEFIKYYGKFKPLKDRNRKTLYAKGVGIVYETLPPYASNSNDLIQKLVRYKVGQTKK